MAPLVCWPTRLHSQQTHFGAVRSIASPSSRAIAQQALQLDADEGLHDAAPNEAYYLDQSSQIASNQIHQIDYRAQKRHVGAGPGATLLPADSVVDCGGGGGGGGVGGVGCVVTT